MQEENAVTRVRRSKRNALSEITNVMSQNEPAADRTTKRRKTSTTEKSSVPVIDLTNVQSEPSINESVNESTLSTVGSQAVNSSLVTTVSLTARDLEVYGFELPPKIERRLPLHMKSADPAQCMDIIDDMYGFYLINQLPAMAKPNFTHLSEVTPRMRTILVDWLIEVHYKYKLFPATLWLCTNILDRYLEKVDVVRNHLQLVGITAMLIACKFEEFRAPSVQDFVSLTDSAFTQQQILEMEFMILETLNFELLVPTTHHFMQRFLYRIKAGERLRLLTYYFAERTLQEKEFFDYIPQVYAAAALYVALKTIYKENQKSGEDVWCEALKEDSQLDRRDFIECARLLLTNASQIPISSSRRKLEAVKKKYNSKTTQHVSEVDLPCLQAL